MTLVLRVNGQKRPDYLIRMRASAMQLNEMAVPLANTLQYENAEMLSSYSLPLRSPKSPSSLPPLLQRRTGCNRSTDPNNSER